MMELLRIVLPFTIPTIAILGIVGMALRHDRFKRSAIKNAEVEELRAELAQLRKFVEDQYSDLTLLLEESTRRDQLGATRNGESWRNSESES